MKTLIVDDDANSRAILQSMIEKGHPELGPIFLAKNLREADELVRKEKPELVFLDVELPDGTGFDLLERVCVNDFKLVFTTAFEHYAVRAFKFNAIDYLLKPFSPDELADAIRKALAKTPVSSGTQSLLNLIDFVRGSAKKLALPMLSGFEYVEVKDIIRCEAEGNYTRVYMRDKQMHLISRTLKNYEQLLVPEGFMRVHAAHLINLKEVKSYRKGEGGYIVMCDGSTVEVSRNKKNEFMALFFA